MWRSGEPPIQGKTRDSNQIPPNYVRSVNLDRETNTFQNSRSSPEIRYPQYPNAGEVSEECRVALARGTKPGEAKSHRGKKKKKKKTKKRIVVFSAFLVPDTTLLSISKAAWQNLVNMATEKYMQDVEQASGVSFSPSPLL